MQGLNFPDSIRQLVAPPLRVSRAGGVFVSGGRRVVSDARGITAGAFTAASAAELREMGDGRWAVKFAAKVRTAEGVESAVVSDLTIDAGCLELG